MKFLKLFSPAHIAGLLRHPHEGVRHVSDDDAARLLAERVAEDVSADFATLDDHSIPVEVADTPVASAGDDASAIPAVQE
jgi:hypothetical protein